MSLERSESDAVFIANLTTHRGFQLLIKDLEDNLSVTETLMADEHETGKALQLLRFWQVVKRITTTLKSHPANLRAVLEQERGFSSLDPYERPITFEQLEYLKRLAEEKRELENG